MKIAFFKSEYGNWFDKLISLWTLGKFSHCEIIDDDGISYSISGTKKTETVYKRIFDEEYKWVIIDISNMQKSYKFNPKFLYNFYVETLNSKYDWFGIFLKFVFNKEVDNNKYYCSEWCVVALNGIFGINHYLSPHGSPNRLYKELKKLVG